MIARMLTMAAILLAIDASMPAQAGDRSSGMSGLATIYSGGRTASGETSSAGGLTAAHRTLPFGTLVRVTSHRNRRSVVVRINDRGPFTRGRIIDLTPAEARQLGFSSGQMAVTLSVVGGNLAGQ
jgi:peptidoglycan lytic transglycosylase